jgi:cell division protein FtsZ
MKFDIPKQEKSIIKVIGVGGGGGNAVAHMFNQGIRGVDFAVCNTDSQAMENNPIPIRINLGPTLTEGRGAGSRPEVGKEACIESIDEVRAYLNEGTKMVFITAGMGGGTGTGAAPIIAKAAKELGILTVGIVTLPFGFEGIRRKKNAAEGLDQLKKNVDSILVISNDKIQEMHGDLPVSEAFGNADDVLTTGAKSIAEIITVPGYINVDFEDVRFVMKDSGVAMMGIGMAEGENRARKAINMALNSPLLEDNDIRGAKHILLNISSAKTREVTMGEIKEITDFVQEEAGYGTDLIWGNCQDDSLGEKLAVTIIATGFETGAAKVAKSPTHETKVLLEDDMEEIGSVDMISAFDNEDTGVTFDFDEEVVQKTVESYGHKSSYTSDPYQQRKENEERMKRQEAENARREYLRKSTTISLDAPDALEKAEKVPAYLRRGAILDEENINVDRARSNGSAVWIDEEGTVIQSGNSFLRPIAD